jgi:hypothetical protein
MESLKVCLFIVLVNLRINLVFCQLNEKTNQTNEIKGKGVATKATLLHLMSQTL